jgi:hypothetical protein
MSKSYEYTNNQYVHQANLRISFRYATLLAVCVLQELLGYRKKKEYMCDSFAYPIGHSNRTAQLLLRHLLSLGSFNILKVERTPRSLHEVFFVSGHTLFFFR